MTKRKMFLASVICFSIAVLAVRTLSQTRGPDRSDKPSEVGDKGNMTEEEREKEIEEKRRQRELELGRLQNMTEQERNRYLAMKRKQQELERKRRRAESKKNLAERRRQQQLETEQRDKEWEKIRQKEEAKGYMYERWALVTTEEQWKIIEPKIEKVRYLRGRGRSSVGLFLTDSSSSGAKTASSKSPSLPAWQWRRPWKGKAVGELTEAQRLAKELIALVEKKNTTPEEFKSKMAALRKARSADAELRRQLFEARRELREVLTIRQEAVLVLMRWI